MASKIQQTEQRNGNTIFGNSYVTNDHHRTRCLKGEAKAANIEACNTANV